MTTDASRPALRDALTAPDRAVGADPRPVDPRSTDPWTGAGLLALRIVLGGTFLLHGIQNLSGAWTGWDTARMADYLGSKGVRASGFFSWVTALSEVAAGLLLLAGLFTSLATVAVVVTMGTSTALKWSVGFFMPGGFEWELSVLACGVALLLAGAGRFSLDRARLSATTEVMLRKVAIGLSAVLLLGMIIMTWGAPPPHVQ